MADASGLGHNNIRAGIFIVAVVALGITVFVVLSGWDPFQSRVAYSARFTIEQGIDGLATGSDVKVGGLIKGSVTGISPQFRKVDGGKAESFNSILVNFELDKDVSIWSNARVTRYMPLLGGSAWLNFDSVGGVDPKNPASKDAKLLAPDAEIKVLPGGGMLATLLGPSNAARTSDALKNIDQFTVFLTEIPDTWNAKIVPMLNNADAVVASIRADYGPWSKKITTFLDNIDTASVKIDQALDDVPPLLASAQKDLDDVGVLLERNAPKIDEAMDNITVMTADGRQIFSELRTNTLAKINKILDTGEQGIDSLTDALNRVDTELALRMPDITMMLANLRQASAQLKLTTLEVRRSPWKLLYTPSSSELAHENLYSSAQSYVLATSELESAAMAFRQVFETNPEILERQPKIKEQVEKYVLDALERYKTAQEQLFSEIVDQ